MVDCTQHLEVFWFQVIKSLCRKVNFAWCLEVRRNLLCPSYAQRRGVASSCGMNHWDRYKGGMCTHSLACCGIGEEVHSLIAGGM